MKKYSVRDICDLTKAEYLLKKYDSPLYVYSEKIIREKTERLLKAAEGFDVKYALKANTNSSIVKILKNLGVKQVDVVSPGEIYKALQCGFEPQNIMYTENFISAQDLTYALSKGVTMNIGALDTLKAYKDKLKGKSIFVRINPRLGAGTSYHVITGGPLSKFGVYQDDIDEFIKVAKDNDIFIKGLHQHIGSNLKKHDEEKFLDTLEYVAGLLPKFQDASYLNIGGGLGVAYKESEQLSDPEQLYPRVREIIAKWEKTLNKTIRIVVEPGRFLVADSATLLCTVTACKNTPAKTFIGTDTGFSHLIRPALYGAYHQIVNFSNTDQQNPRKKATVCGNICESTDILGNEIEISGKIGDILGIQNTGAYGFSMSMNYNQRPRPAQVMITTSNEDILIRRRETFEDLIEKL